MSDDDAIRRREARARSALRVQGYRLVKSRARNPAAPDFGGYMVVDGITNTVAAGELGSPRAMDLDQVEAFIREK